MVLRGAQGEAAGEGGTAGVLGRRGNTTGVFNKSEERTRMGKGDDG